MPDNTQTGDIDFATWRARIRNDVSSNYHQEMGIALEREGSVEAACAHFRQALALDPRLIISTDRLVDLLRRIGRDTEAEALHRRALESNPHYQAQARFDFLLRDYEGPARPHQLPLPDMATIGAPEAVPAAVMHGMRTLQAYALLSNDQTDEGCALLDRVEAEAILPNHRERIADLFRGLGQDRYGRAAYAAAMAAFTTARRLDPQGFDACGRAVLLLGVSALMLERHAAAIATLEALVDDRSADQVQVNRFLAVCHQALGSWPQAVYYHRRALAVQPDADSCFFLANALLYADLPDAALDACVEGLGLSPNHDRGFLFLTAAHLAKGDAAAAEQALVSATAHPPTVGGLLSRYRSAVHLNKGNHWEALAAIDLALQQMGDSRHPLIGEYLVQKGGILRAMGRTGEAVEIFTTALPLAYGTPWARVGLMAGLIDIGRRDQAEEVGDTLSRLPRLGWGAVQRARLRLLQGKPAEAAALLSDPCVGRPGLGWADFQLGGTALAWRDLKELGDLADASWQNGSGGGA